MVVRGPGRGPTRERHALAAGSWKMVNYIPEIGESKRGL
jgi:hypothetical protein